ncbi:unnamed protein product [Chironomus riparius]|uniref:DUF4773 domain-containing protein n=1 Tax=Chironomus riparius TaxID=315576 RepID=A0A9N9RQ29_9DIPT|nr:unnamed protein product [Chironomus riparius]
MKFNYFFILLISSFIIIANCGILDFISLDDEDDAPQKRDRENDCVCLKGNAEGNNCVCCLDFQFSDSFRLDPACVKIRYVSQSEGVHMNLTLGKSYSKAATIKTDKPEEPVCLSMLGGVAKMCSKFNGLIPSSNNGLVGCLTMQPKIFGESPVTFDFPCFDLNQQEIRMIEGPKKTEEEEKDETNETDTPEPTEEDETIGGIRVGDILSVVSRTADQGIKIITEFLGLGDDEKKPAAVESKTAPEDTKNETKKT